MSRRLRHALDLLRELTGKETQLRYRGTYLGVLWSLGNPVALAVVLHFALKRVLNIGGENFALFLLAALIPWQFIGSSLSRATHAFTGNAHLLQNLPMPRSVLCAAVVLSGLLHFRMAFAVIVVLRLIYGLAPAEWSWLAGLPLLILLQSLLLAGCTLIIATTNAYLRDLEHFVGVGLTLLFHLSPIIYPVALIPESLKWVVWVNPFAPLLICWRALLLDGAFPPGLYLLLAAAHASLLFLAGVFIYRRNRGRLAAVL